MAQLIHDSNRSKFNPFGDSDIVRDIKENFCNVALDYDLEIKFSTTKKFYKLPDGSKIPIGSERFTCPEAMFQPKIMDSNNEFTGIHEATYKAILNCDLDLRDKIS